MSGEDPFGELCSRLLQLKAEQMTPAERLFDNVCAFLGDALNGGIFQAMSNSTGDNFADVEDFATRFCGEETLALFADIRQLFPGAVVPKDRSTREDILDGLQGNVDVIFENFDVRFALVESMMQSQLVEFARLRQSEFENVQTVGRGNA
jgi:hypothetical protein